MKQVTDFIISSSQVMPGVYLVWLECPQIASQAQPGQFVMVRCGEDTLLRRPLSIHQRDGNRIALLFNVIGKGTSWLSQRKAGDELDLLGPLGNSFSIDSPSKNLLLVAGGMGIAPLYFLVQESLKRKYRVILLYGTADDKRYPVVPTVEMVAATEDGTIGHKGMITDLMPQYTDWADQVFACGPIPMYCVMANDYPQLKHKPVQVSLEVRMGCGRGICYGCTIRTKGGLKQVCKDGPVFDLGDIIWNEVNFI